jgi:hypothetical protein
MEKLNQSISLKNDMLVSEKFQLGPYASDGNNEFAVIFKDTTSYHV